MHSRRLKAGKFNIELSINEAMENLELVTIADNMVLRFIDELNGVGNIDTEWHDLNQKIRATRKKEATKESRRLLQELYLQRNKLQFVQDYVCIVMDSVKDYRTLYKEGCIINGIKFKRLLATTGGVKSGIVVFVAERLWKELRLRLDNGRDLNKPLVPAKFGAYESLACSSSVAVSKPKGILVVPDCYTEFKEDVITIDDRTEGEPVLSSISDYSIRKNCSDGFGTMMPRRAEVWSRELGLDYVMSGCNTRYAFEKGMLVTFDHIDFAEKINGASESNPSGYIVKDVWGNDVDVRAVDVVLTESMLKLWDSYSSIENYISCCDDNHYCFSITKVAPKYLDEEWTTNYQFLQSYDLDDNDIRELVQPTIEMISDILGGDYRKLILYANGKTIDDNTFLLGNNMCLKALMADKCVIDDPYIIKTVYNMIENRIRQAKLGKLNVHGHFCIACGDPFSLWQSIFGLEVTGLLKKREIYSKFWLDANSLEVVCFRAPMTCHNNIRKMSVSNNEDAKYWYRYINTMIVFNSWDSSMDAMNGEDYDGDQNFVTDNPVLLRRTVEEPTIFCIQRKADKHIINEDLIVESNINSFGNKIGKITNDITSQFDLLTKYNSNTLEYKTLSYRIKTGQLYQQNEIDKAKGIVTKPRPSYWFNYRDNKIADDDTYASRHHKKFNQLIAVEKKPYFMIYNYEAQNKEYKNYIKNTEANCKMRFGVGVDDLETANTRNADEEQFIKYYHKLMPVMFGHCVINRISKIFEDKFSNFIRTFNASHSNFFNYAILKGVHDGDEINDNILHNLSKIYSTYLKNVKKSLSELKYLDVSDKEMVEEKRNILSIMEKNFKEQCNIACPNKVEQTSALIDLLYKNNSSKRFVWEICGEQIIENLLEANNYIIEYPVQSFSGDFMYCGKKYSMVKSNLSNFYLERGINEFQE